MGSKENLQYWKNSSHAVISFGDIFCCLNAPFQEWFVPQPKCVIIQDMWFQEDVTSVVPLPEYLNEVFPDMLIDHVQHFYEHQLNDLQEVTMGENIGVHKRMCVQTSVQINREIEGSCTELTYKDFSCNAVLHIASNLLMCCLWYENDVLLM
jgi:hypothetical protein